MKQLSQLSKLANVVIQQSQKDQKDQKVDGEVVLKLSVDDVVPKPQVRKLFTDIEELGQNIAQDGQHQPIVVFPKNKNGKYVIQKGERRWRACKVAGIKTIKAIVNSAVLDKLDQVAGELGENIHRVDLNSFEIADALQLYIDSGWSQADVGRRINKSRAFVSQHLSLTRIPAPIRALLTPEITKDTTTLHIVAQIHDIDPVACRQLAERAKQNKALPRVEARKLLDRLRGVDGPEDGDESSQAPSPRARGKLAPAAASTGVPGDDGNDAGDDDGATGAMDSEQQAEAMRTSAKNSPAAQKPATGTTVATKRDDSHMQPGAVTTVLGPGAQEVAPEGASYSIVAPGQIAVVCSVKVLKVARLGELCLNRVDKESEFVWVKLYDEDGEPYAKDVEAEYVSVPAHDVKVVELRARG